ncbi:MAG TPA: hypothetical protein DD728_03990 [Hyphomonas atlantica]|uniref:Uncharacterized protein n=1 Tax=Hyphomonas atlantica TaxID=1280948 RepID=A0A356W349_9PROT|nr:hypothetical protein [Hyphomonas atlantica]
MILAVESRMKKSTLRNCGPVPQEGNGWMTAMLCFDDDARNPFNQGHTRRHGEISVFFLQHKLTAMPVA